MGGWTPSHPFQKPKYSENSHTLLVPPSPFAAMAQAINPVLEDLTQVTSNLNKASLQPSMSFHNTGIVPISPFGQQFSSGLNHSVIFGPSRDWYGTSLVRCGLEFKTKGLTQEIQLF